MTELEAIDRLAAKDEELHKLRTALKQVVEAVRKSIEHISQYENIEFYIWLMSDYAGSQSDPTKRAIETKILLTNVLIAIQAILGVEETKE